MFPSLTMMTSTDSEESVARNNHTETQTYRHTYRQTDYDTISKVAYHFTNYKTDLFAHF